LGFCEIEISVPGLKFRAGKKYPASLTTLGDHIKRKRLDLGLWQKDVAERIGVSIDSITFWENNRSQPQIQFYPKIIKFLGYYPLPQDMKTLSGKIKIYRHVYGLTQKQFGNELEVNGSTVCSWENDEFHPEEDNLKRLNKLLFKLKQLS
jgi:DNA-binding XRE family transcriptional regulator